MVKLLIPDLPSPTEYLPYLEEMESRSWYTNFGPLEGLLTNEIISLIKSIHCNSDFELALTNSGTSALQAAILSQPLPRKATFLVPTFTFPGTIMAILQLGHKVRLADIDSNGLLSSEVINDEIIEETDVFLPVGALGKYVDLEQWKSVSKNLEKTLIADCAASFPYQSPSCSMAFSLHATKPIGIGEGGIVIRPKSDLPPLKSVLNFGFHRGEVKFSGGNFKLSEVHAAVGLAQLKRYRKVQSQRIRIFKSLYSGIAKLSYIKSLYDKKEILLSGFTAPYFPIILSQNVKIEHFQAYLNLRKIETRRWYFPPLHEQHFCKRNSSVIIEKEYPLANKFKNNIICLPMHSKLSFEDINQVILALRDYQEDHSYYASNTD